MTTLVAFKEEVKKGTTLTLRSFDWNTMHKDQMTVWHLTHETSRLKECLEKKPKGNEKHICFNFFFFF